MTREQLVELMARAAWEESDEPEPFDDLPKSMRDDWIGYQHAALAALEERMPAVREAIIAALN